LFRSLLKKEEEPHDIIHPRLSSHPGSILKTLSQSTPTHLGEYQKDEVGSLSLPHPSPIISPQFTPSPPFYLIPIPIFNLVSISIPFQETKAVS